MILCDNTLATLHKAIPVIILSERAQSSHFTPAVTRYCHRMPWSEYDGGDVHMAHCLTYKKHWSMIITVYVKWAYFLNGHLHSVRASHCGVTLTWDVSFHAVKYTYVYPSHRAGYNPFSYTDLKPALTFIIQHWEMIHLHETHQCTLWVFLWMNYTYLTCSFPRYNAPG